MLLLVALVAILALIFSVSLLMGRKHAIDQLPGPPSWPLVGTSLEFVKGRDVAFAKFNEFAEKYFPTYRTWQGVIPVVHPLLPEHVELILTSSQHITKSHDYNFLKEWLGTGLLISTGSKWHSRRKMLTPAFHFKILEDFLPMLSDKTKILVHKLRAHVGRTEGVDVVPLVTRCALDVICETAMGTTINAQEENDSPYVTAIYDIGDLVVYRLVRPWLYPSWIYKLTAAGRKQAKCLEVLHGFTKKVIRERREEYKKLKSTKTAPVSADEDSVYMGAQKKKTAFLDLLLEVSDKDGGLTDEDIREEVDTFMFEGHDTTAMAMSWALYFLGTYFEVQARCAAELGEIFSGSGRDATLSDLNNMKYLERVIKETLRLRPSVVFVARSLDKSLTLGNIEYPAGTKINVHIYNIHRNPNIYPDPEKFDPDRFLPENCVGRHPYSYIPFSAGPRNCIGQKFAMMEMKLMLSTLLRHFRLRCVDPVRSYVPLPDIILRPKFGVIMNLASRSMP